MGFVENVQLAWAVCKIGSYTLFRRIFGSKRPAPRPEYQPICLGITGAGKTTLLCRLCGHAVDDIKPTEGFEIKSVQLKSCILNVKEIGGGDKIRKYWKHYYNNVHGILFVLDSTTALSNDATAECLKSVLSDPLLEGLPIVILANCQDKKDAVPTDVLEQQLNIEYLCAGRHWAIRSCSYNDDVDSLKQILDDTLGQFICSLYFHEEEKK